MALPPAIITVVVGAMEGNNEPEGGEERGMGGGRKRWRESPNLAQDVVVSKRDQAHSGAKGYGNHQTEDMSGENATAPPKRAQKQMGGRVRGRIGAQNPGIMTHGADITTAQKVAWSTDS